MVLADCGADPKAAADRMRAVSDIGRRDRLARDGFGVLAATIGFGNCRMTWQRACAAAAVSALLTLIP